MYEKRKNNQGRYRLYDLADSKELRKMGSERIRELLDQTYEMRKDSPKTCTSSGSSANDYIDEWISVVVEELQHRGNKAN